MLYVLISVIITVYLVDQINKRVYFNKNIAKFRNSIDKNTLGNVCTILCPQEGFIKQIDTYIPVTYLQPKCANTYEVHNENSTPNN